MRKIRYSLISATLLAGMASAGQNLVADNLQDWKLSWKGEEVMSVTDGVLTYEQAPKDKMQNAFFEQTITLEPDQFYELSMEYRSEDGLTPVVAVAHADAKDAGKPIRLFRMPPSRDWKTYTTKTSLGSRKGNFRIRICPAAKPNRIFRNKEKVRSDHPGKAQFRNVRLVKSDFSVPEVVRPPKAFETETYVYKTVGDLELVLKIDRPLNVDGPVPVIFWVHGGGWSVGSPDNMLWGSAMHASQGVAGARVQYRLIKQGGTFKKTFGDLLDAVEWLRQHAEELNIDMSRLIMAGGSAGGHLSSILAQKTPECIGYIGFCGMYDLTDVGESRFAYQPKGFMVSLDFDTLATGSAIHNIRDNPPQTLLMHGDADATIDCDVAVRFAEALRAKGGKVKLVLMPGGGHDMLYPYRQQKEIHGLLHDLGIYTNDFETSQRKWAERAE
ncbi:alpha/beta hydrolase [Tichowtungia aerotolerans]|uniref:Alpha/beta hydrolase fold domain-containing protein n=1 Tax=Tichowtungia aerotolerans TaxID=2697043 RepID=A0A6P1M8W6_9BACT|nr:alpha/beta hydrolase [Tichowtungia aerotolerans]QHI70331.1 alpha/beta hydrolase fold domain-containing protein [Tichowtungia aerotolerans]